MSDPGEPGEPARVRLQDIKEKLSEVHICAIEITQALEGRKHEETRAKIDGFVKLALATQRDFGLYLEANEKEGDEEEEEAVSESSDLGHAATTVRRGSLRVCPGDDEGDGGNDKYVPSTSAKVKYDADRDAILQAIKDLENDDASAEVIAAAQDSLSQLSNIPQDSMSSVLSGNRGSMLSALEDLRKHYNSQRRRSSGSDPIVLTRREPIFPPTSPGQDRAARGNETAAEKVLYVAMDSSSSGNPYVPLTSQNIRDELDRAAAAMAQQEFSTDKLKKETPEHFEESDYGSCSDEIEAKGQALEPYGGPMSYKLKSGYISDWLSTDDHNLEGLLEKRGKGVPRPREEVPKS